MLLLKSVGFSQISMELQFQSWAMPDCGLEVPICEIATLFNLFDQDIFCFSGQPEQFVFDTADEVNQCHTAINKIN